MSINYQHFMNKRISEISIGYDWFNEMHFARIVMLDNFGKYYAYKICELNEYSLYDDFQAAYIERIKFVIDEGSIYLCLDPVDDTNIPDLENDNLYFHGVIIEEIDISG